MTVPLLCCMCRGCFEASKDDQEGKGPQ